MKFGVEDGEKAGEGRTARGVVAAPIGATVPAEIVGFGAGEGAGGMVRLIDEVGGLAEGAAIPVRANDGNGLLGAHGGTLTLIPTSCLGCCWFTFLLVD